MHSVLVVDDSHVIRRLVEVCLEPLEVTVTTVGSGADAQLEMMANPPDALILDVGLPDISGWEVLEFARSQSVLDGLAIIMMTGRTDAADVERADSAGADRYLMKPFRPAELRRILLDTLHGVPAPIL
ncbi:MAG: response regulator [Actinomycetia bacterium]|nr:response regulator [Actinomycetes bacterium]